MAKAKSKSKKSEVTYNIEEIYCFLDNRKKVFLRIAWNGKEAKNELRTCWEDKDGELHIGKGVEITEEDLDAIMEKFPRKKKAVDFAEVFESSRGIMEKREAGYSTENGFIKLRRIRKS